MISQPNLTLNQFTKFKIFILAIIKSHDYLILITICQIVVEFKLSIKTVANNNNKSTVIHQTAIA